LSVKIKIGFWYGLLAGFLTFLTLFLLSFITNIATLRDIALIISPMTAGFFSDDNSWFWTGFIVMLTIITVPTTVLTLLAIAGRTYYFFTLYPAMGVFTLMMIPIIGILSAIIGGIFSFIGRTIGEKLKLF